MSIKSYDDAARAQDKARADLREVNQAKDRAAGMRPDGADEEHRAKAAGRRWTGPSPFDRASTRNE